MYLRDATMVTPQMLMLFAVDVEYQDGVVLVNKWISFNMDEQVCLFIFFIYFSFVSVLFPPHFEELLE